MKGKYINTKVLLACLSTKQHVTKNIHTQLQETIAEHKRIMRQFVSLTLFKDGDTEMQEGQAA
jgi:hypothetical protein